MSRKANFLVEEVAKLRFWRDEPPIGDRILGRPKAREIVNATFDAIAAALRRGEDVTLPFGTFRCVPNKVAPYRSWRWGQPRTFYRKRFRIVFEPSSENTR